MSSVTLLGIVTVVEMLYHVTLGLVGEPRMELFGLTIDTSEPFGWFVAAVLIAIGGFGFRRTKKEFQRAWGEANAEIEDTIRGGRA